MEGRIRSQGNSCWNFRRKSSTGSLQPPPPSNTSALCRPYRSAYASYSSGVVTIDTSGHKRDLILSHHENNIGKGKELLCLFKPLRHMVGGGCAAPCIVTYSVEKSKWPSSYTNYKTNYLHQCNVLKSFTL